MGLFISIASPLSAQQRDVRYRWQQQIYDTSDGVPNSHDGRTDVGLGRAIVLRGESFLCRERNGREQSVYQVLAWAQRLKVEKGAKGDGDWHIKLTGTKNGNVANGIVIEIPPDTLNGAYFTARQDFLKAIGDAGARIAQNGDVLPPVRIRVTGLAFFDREHRGAGTNPPHQHERCSSR